MSDLFEELTPPPGGLAGLRVKLERERPPHRARFALAFSAALAIVVVAWPTAPERPETFASSLLDPARAPLTVHDGGALLVHDDAKVAIYFTSGSSAKSDSGATAPNE